MEIINKEKFEEKVLKAKAKKIDVDDLKKALEEGTLSV